MPRGLFLVIALIAIGIVGYQFFKPSIATSSPISAQERLAGIAQSGESTAEEVGALCENYPELTAKYLKNRVIHLTGIVQNLYLSGLDGRRAGISIFQGPRRKLIVVYDLDHYSVLGLEPTSDHRVHFVIVGNEMLRITPAGVYHQGTTRLDVPQEVRKVKFTRSLPFNDVVTFNRVTKDAIIVDANPK